MSFESFLLPITEFGPCGEDLSFSPEFDAIAELRRFDDPTLDQGEWKRDIKTADYPGVQRVCSELLSGRTKDLRLTGWLLDALARTGGFAGMAHGLTLCASLCEQFWLGLHPLGGEEGFEQRVGSLSWMLQQITDLAQTTPLIVGQAPGAVYGRRVIESVRSRKALSHDHGSEPSEEQIGVALGQTRADALLSNLSGCTAALQALARLQVVIDGHLGVEGPNFSTARNALQDTEHLLRRFASERGLLGTADGATSIEAVSSVVAEHAEGMTASASLSGAPATRAQALAQLRAVAAFFRRTEPHSPVAYLADKAARWGEVPLHVWLRSVMKDQTTLAQLEELLGVDPPASPGV